MSQLQRITIYADDSGSEPSADAQWVLAWLARWGGEVRVANYSSGGWEHVWDVEGPPRAIAEVPDHLRCGSEWSNPELYGKKR
jgi:hypothetical protein